MSPYSVLVLKNFLRKKCKQTAVSQKLSKVKKFSRYFLHLMRCLNWWDNKKFWGAKSGPLTHTSAVKNYYITFDYPLT